MTFPAHPGLEKIKPDELKKLIQYLASVPRYVISYTAGQSHCCPPSVLDILTLACHVALGLLSAIVV